MGKTESQLTDNFYVNVELVASRELRELVKKLQNSLNLHEKTDYLPGTSDCPVHLTLYSTYSSMTAISEMIHVLESISNRFKPISLEIGESGCFADGSIVLNCERVTPLILLHEEIVSGLNPLRDITEPPEEFAVELSDEQIGRFREIGDPFALQTYRPHVTIARVGSYQRAKKLSESLPIVRRKVTFSRLAARIWLSENSTASKLFECILQ